MFDTKNLSLALESQETLKARRGSWTSCLVPTYLLENFAPPGAWVSFGSRNAGCWWLTLLAFNPPCPIERKLWMRSMMLRPPNPWCSRWCPGTGFEKMRVALGLMRCKISVDATEATWLPISGFSMKSPCILTKLSLASLTMDSSCPAAVKIGWMRGRPSPAGFLTKLSSWSMTWLGSSRSTSRCCIRSMCSASNTRNSGGEETGHEKVRSPGKVSGKLGETETWTDHKTIGHHNQRT